MFSDNVVIPDSEGMTNHDVAGWERVNVPYSRFASIEAIYRLVQAMSRADSLHGYALARPALLTIGPA